jgi:aspartyl aminopeptidase
MATDARDEARALAAFVDRSPSPFHASESAAAELERAGFQRLLETDAWPRAPGAFYVRRGASLAAWTLPEGAPAALPFRVVGAHTDSPNLRVKPRPDVTRAGYRQLGVEVYGSALLNSWLDRDLGLSGRAFVRGPQGVVERLFRIDRPILRIPQLAIHLNRELTTEGLHLNPQEHLLPIHGLEGFESVQGFRELVAPALEVDPRDVLAWDAMCHDTVPACLVGAREEFLSAPRLDDLACAFAGLRALLGAARRPQRTPMARALVLFDHEEVGSGTSRGAESPFLATCLERILSGLGGGRDELHRSLAASLCVSADMAHATHPNYREKHDPEHWIRMNGGPVIKVNTNQRYASEAETEAVFQEACERACVPWQKYSHRNDLACGSTIGPLTAANLGLRTVDVGAPQLAMHSARELAGALDAGYLVRALTAFYEGAA